jgi:hypothetical protein
MIGRWISLSALAVWAAGGIINAPHRTEPIYDVWALWTEAGLFVGLPWWIAAAIRRRVKQRKARG